MTIKDALLGLAKNLEEDLAKWNEIFTKEKADYKYFAPLDVCTSYVREIRMIANLTPENMVVQSKQTSSSSSLALQEELKKVELFENILGAKMVYMVGGNSDGDMVEIDPKMPVEAYNVFANQVYQLQQDGKLHFSEDQTKRLKESVK